MSVDDAEQFWHSSDVKPFNFDDEDQPNTTNSVGAHPTASATEPAASRSSHIKTLGSILAPKSTSNEPFLKPSVIMCKDLKLERLVEFLDKHSHDPMSPMIPKTKRDPKSYIMDIIYKNVPIDFSAYKSKTEKLILLDCAILCSDGNLIFAVSKFMSNTLKQALFYEELVKRPIALDIYTNYLRTTGRLKHLSEFVTMHRSIIGIPTKTTR